MAYCKHLLEAANVHCELAEREEMQNVQRLEVMRQMELADETRRKAEEQRKVQVIILSLEIFNVLRSSFLLIVLTFIKLINAVGEKKAGG